MKLVEMDIDQIKSIDSIQPAQTVMALGYFDGVHKGHQTVIAEAMNEAKKRGLQSAVMTFHPHPKEVLGQPDQPMRYLTPFQAKINRLQALGVDVVYAVHFTKSFSQLTPQQFVDQFIVSLGVQHIVAGFDFTYGVKGSGTMKTMGSYAHERFTYTVIEKVADQSDKISSTRIRTELAEGRVQDAAALLGAPYAVTGKVVHGDARGRSIGFPTANVETEERFLIPKTGVYAVTVTVGVSTFRGMANVGYKPTFVDHLPEPVIEAHLFDFKDDLYGKYIDIHFIERIRDEQKFNGINEIIAQLNRDKETSLTLLKNRKL